MQWMRGRGTKSSSLPPAMQTPQMHPTVHQHLSPRHQTLCWNLNLNHKIQFHSHPNRSQLKNCSLNHSKRKTLNQNWVEADTLDNALSGPHAKEWQTVLDYEIGQLEKLGTWVIEDLPKGHNSILCSAVQRILDSLVLLLNTQFSSGTRLTNT